MEIKEVVVHSIESSKYKVQFEQSATKGVLGFKCEANGDDMEKVEADATRLLAFSLKRVSLVYPSPAPEGYGKPKPIENKLPDKVEIPF